MERYLSKARGFVVEAVQLTEHNVDAVANWTQSQIVEEKDAFNHAQISEGLNLKTPMGKKRVSRGMYVVKFKDAFYIAHPGQFEDSYVRMSLKEDLKEAVIDPVTVVKPSVQDPFEGMTRFDMGPKP